MHRAERIATCIHAFILFLASYDDRVNLLGILRDIYGSEVVYMAPPVLPDLSELKSGKTLGGLVWSPTSRLVVSSARLP